MDSSGPTLSDLVGSCFSSCLQRRQPIRLPDSPSTTGAPLSRIGVDSDALSLHSNFNTSDGASPRNYGAGKLRRWSLFWSWFFGQGVIRLEDPPSPIASPVTPIDNQTVARRKTKKKQRRVRSDAEDDFNHEGEEDARELSLGIQLNDEQAYEAMYGNGHSIPPSPSSPNPTTLPSESGHQAEYFPEKSSTNLFVPSDTLTAPTPSSPTPSHDSFIHLQPGTGESSTNGGDNILSFTFPVVSEVVRLARERTLEREKAEREGIPYEELQEEEMLDGGEALFALSSKKKRKGPNGTEYSSENTRSGSRSSRRSAGMIEGERDTQSSEFMPELNFQVGEGLEVPKVEKKKKKRSKRSDRTETSASKSTTGRSERSVEEMNDDFHEGLFDEPAHLADENHLKNFQMEGKLLPPLPPSASTTTEFSIEGEYVEGEGITKKKKKKKRSKRMTQEEDLQMREED